VQRSFSKSTVRRKSANVAQKKTIKEVVRLTSAPSGYKDRQIRTFYLTMSGKQTMKRKYRARFTVGTER